MLPTMMAEPVSVLAPGAIVRVISDKWLAGARDYDDGRVLSVDRCLVTVRYRGWVERWLARDLEYDPTKGVWLAMVPGALVETLLD
jgi:hypothetical protein